MAIDKKSELKKVIKFGVTGGMNTVVDFVMYTVAAMLLHIHPSVDLLIAQAIGFCCGMINSYIVNRSWTFKSNGKFFSMEMVKFIVVNGAALLVSLGVMAVLTGIFGTADTVTCKLVYKVVVTCFTLSITFFGSRLWVFKAPESDMDKE